MRPVILVPARSTRHGPTGTISKTVTSHLGVAMTRVQATSRPSLSRSNIATRTFPWIAWAFVGYVLVATVVAVLAKLPASANNHGDVHTVGSDALFDGTALGPPLWSLPIAIVIVLAATRGHRAKIVDTALTVLPAAAYIYGEIGELITTTSPLTGAKWTLVITAGALGIALATITAAVAIVRFILLRADRE